MAALLSLQCPARPQTAISTRAALTTQGGPSRRPPKEVSVIFKDWEELKDENARRAHLAPPSLQQHLAHLLRLGVLLKELADMQQRQLLLLAPTGATAPKVPVDGLLMDYKRCFLTQFCGSFKHEGDTSKMAYRLERLTCLLLIRIRD